MPSSSELFDEGVSMPLQQTFNLVVMEIIIIFEDIDDARILHSPRQHSIPTFGLKSSTRRPHSRPDTAATM
jgi:hypothetical protein